MAPRDPQSGPEVANATQHVPIIGIITRVLLIILGVLSTIAAVTMTARVPDGRGVGLIFLGDALHQKCRVSVSGALSFHMLEC
jgi:hypothetical protein